MSIHQHPTPAVSTQLRGKVSIKRTMLSDCKYIRDCTMEVAFEVASNLRPEDRSECVEGWGINPLLEIPLASQRGFCVSFMVPNGETAGVAGILEDGQIWMLCTPAIHKYPITFAREAKRFIDSRQEKLLYNVVDKRNVVHLKLLKFLGFKFIREIFFRTKPITIY